MKENPIDVIREAMEGADKRTALYESCRLLISGGQELSNIIGILSNLLEEYRAVGDTEREYVVLEMMDILEGGVSDYLSRRFFAR